MNDDIPPQRIARLTPIAEVLARMATRVQPVAPLDAPVREAVGRVLGADIIAPHDLPSAAIALRDGYAVAADETMDAGGYAPVRLASAIHRVSTGDPLPTGTDAVAPPDAVAVQDAAYEISSHIAPAGGVLAPGGDVRAGTVLLRAGARLRAVDQAVLSLAGIGRVSVRTPSVAVVSASDAHDAVLDAVLSLIRGLVISTGADLAAAIRTARGNPSAAFADPAADAFVVIGGSGLGAADRSVQALARAGEIEAHGIAIGPGETAAFGFVGSRPVLILPGRLDAALAVWLVLGRPLLDRLSASAAAERPFPARLARKISSSLGLTEVVPVRVRDGGAEPIASGYLPWSSLAQADGWILIPAESEGYPPDAEVMVRPWP